MTAWEELQKECMQCHSCPLSETRNSVVFGAGSPEAEVLLVGEGPGASEDEQGVPFVGVAGKLLDDMLAMIGIQRESVYITNIVKCRPPQNRDPLNPEKEACLSYLRRQIALMQPKIIVCLGRIAAMELIRPEYKITIEHGQFSQKDGIWYTALYHPAALLRDGSKKPESFVDLKILQKKIREVCRHTPIVFP